MGQVNHTFIIAEAGVNHNGSLDMAKRLIEVAADSGADAVKFQTFQADKLTGKASPKAEYQIQSTSPIESQWEMLRRLELDCESHRILVEYSRNCGIQFLSTPFDMESIDFLAIDLDLPYIKTSSGEITNAPFLLRVAQTQKPVILSTGMSTLGEVETALGVLAYGYLGRDYKPAQEKFITAFGSEEGQAILHERVTLLHCTTEYPAPFRDINLRVIDNLASAFGLPVGFSDHSAGIAAPIAAVARGAVMIEKHFTLDRNLPGPDHKASLEPAELKLMVQSIREVEVALGSSQKVPAPSEMKNRSIVRRSLVAACNIKKGEVFSEANLAAKRPGTGIAPGKYWEYIGKKAARDFQKNEMVTP